MSVKEYIEQMKFIQCSLLKFLEEESNAEENFENFVKIITDQKINEEKHKFKSLLQLINNIGSNHQRVFNFIDKIENILQNFKKDITNFFTNSEIFKLFENNKRIILFLVQEKIIIIDEYIVSQITSHKNFILKYPEYFGPEISQFLTKEFINKYNKENTDLQNDVYIEEIRKEVPKEFYSKRKEGENDNSLCKLIRLNDVKNFGIYVNRNCISLDCCIKKSVFETNYILSYMPNIELIEYASFYGSIDIIRYMHMKGSSLTSSMWKYAIHSQNEELIKYLEDNQVLPPENNYEIILKESIKCHHNDVSNYIIHNLIEENDLKYNIENKFYENLYRYSVEFYNYYFFPENIEYKFMLFYLCEFDYYTLVDLYLQHQSIDINAKNITTQLFK